MVLRIGYIRCWATSSRVIINLVLGYKVTEKRICRKYVLYQRLTKLLHQKEIVILIAMNGSKVSPTLLPVLQKLLYN